MNFPFSTPSPYLQAAMAQAVQAMMSGGPLPPNCVVMSIPYQPGQPIFPPTNPFSPFPTNSQTRALVPFVNNGQQISANYNYPIVSSNNSKKKSKKLNRHQPHSNIYNSSSFDTYMKDLSWSRLFDHHSGKTTKVPAQDSTSIATQDEKSNSSKKQRSNSSSSSNSSTTSDETIRRVNVTSQQTNHLNGKGTTKGSLPFKYSSEFVPGLAKQQGVGPAGAPPPPPPNKGKSHETTNVKKAQ